MQPTALLGVLLLPVLANAQYQMVKEYVGDNFFNDWTFYNNCEPLPACAADAAEPG